MTARELMTDSPVTASPQTTIADAWDLMRELAVRHIPVVQRGAVVGMVSDRDLANVDVVRLLAEEGAAAVRQRLQLPIATIMSADVVAVGSEVEMADVIALLLEHRVGALPVVVPGTRNIVGIVSYVDVLRAVAAELDGIDRRPPAPGARLRQRTRRARPSGGRRPR